MFAKAMEIYWLQLVVILMWRYLTNENQRLSRLSIRCIIVIFVILSHNSLLTSKSYYLDPLYCVRWSPACDMLAVGASDKTAALLNIKTGKKVYTKKSSDGSNFLLIAECSDFNPIIRSDNVSLFHFKLKSSIICKESCDKKILRE